MARIARCLSVLGSGGLATVLLLADGSCSPFDPASSAPGLDAAAAPTDATTDVVDAASVTPEASTSVVGCDLDMAFQTPVLVPGLSNATIDEHLSLSADEAVAVYHSTRSGEIDILGAVRDGGNLGPPSTVHTAPLNSPTRDFDPALSPDGNLVVYAQSPDRNQHQDRRLERHVEVAASAMRRTVRGALRRRSRTSTRPRSSDLPGSRRMAAASTSRATVRRGQEASTFTSHRGPPRPADVPGARRRTTIRAMLGACRRERSGSWEG